MSACDVIFLNGASSSGKSTIVSLLQSSLDRLYVHTGIDHFLERVPLRFHAWGDGSAPDGPGITWVMPGGSPPVSELRIGPAGFRLLSGMYRAVAALVAAGNPVIVDDVIFDERVLAEAVTQLRGVDVLFVGVRCPSEIAQQREVARGDRMLGLAQIQTDLVHRHGIYDLEVDTSQLSADECAALIRERAEEGPPPTAFDRLRAGVGGGP